MKNLKKVLSVALALAMALSLMTTAFAVTKASSLTGYDKVGTDYTEAVDVMVASGIIDGVSGDIQAQGNVTREQAAKIICTMLLGSNASQLATTSAYFSDVAASRWSAPYIAYCVENGIVSGVGGGKFNPTGNVTGNQFAKMLLVALGYKADVEGYTGTNWATNVSGDAADAGIYNGAATLNKNAAATREQACLYAFNTLLADLVQYSSTGTSITIGNTSINVGGSKAAAITSSSKNYNTIKDEVAASGNPISATNPSTIQFAEKYLSQLKLTGGVMVGGKLGRTFSYAGTDLGTFAATATVLATSTNGTGLANLTDATKSTYIKATPDTALTLYYNDVIVGASGAYTSATIGAATVNATTAQLTSAKRGVIVNFVDTNSNGKYDVVTITEKKVVALSAAPTVTTTGSVTNVTIGSIPAQVSTNISYPAGLVKGDVVLYYVGANGYYYVEKATAVTGQKTADSANNTIVFAGTTYHASDLTGATATANTLNGLASYKDGTVYLDNGDNIVVANLVSAPINYVIGAKFAATAGVNATVEMLAVFPDGISKVVNVASVNGATPIVASNAIEGGIYTYSIDTNGNYKLSADASTVMTTDTLTAGKVNFSTNTVALKGNSATVFVVYNATTKAYTVYTGIANIPTMTGATGSYVVNASGANNGYVNLVYVSTALTSTAASTGTYVYLTTGAYSTRVQDTTDATVYYYTYATVDGTVSVKGTATTPTATTYTAGGTSTTPDLAAGIYKVTKVGDYVTEFIPVTEATYAASNLTGSADLSLNDGYKVYGTNTAVTVPVGGTIAVGSDNYTITDDTVLYYVSALGVVTPYTGAAITTAISTDASVYVKVSNETGTAAQQSAATAIYVHA